MRGSGRLIIRCSAVVVGTGLLALEAQAQGTQRRSSVATASVPPGIATMTAFRRQGDIVVDGKLDEAAWQSATPSREFTQSYPNPGRPPLDPTEVRVLYDGAAIYVGVRMFDSRPDSIAAQLARRDVSGIYSDWAHVIIDSYRDRRTAFRFTVNPKGVQKDVYTSNDNSEDTNWDAVWEVGTRIDSLGWVAEYRIPLSQLRFASASAGEEQLWGFQVMRDVARRNERSSWSPWEPTGAGFVSKFGDLKGLVDLPQPKRLEVMPYASAKVTRAPGSSANPFYRATDATPNVGADVRYGLPGGLTLTATINPDFGQVEVDPAVVNLSAFETFFPEKRPFFLEGSDVFTFGRLRNYNDYGGQTFFYTRRVGRSPSRYPSGAGIDHVDMPEQTTIAGAAKVTGRLGPWTVGVLNALTSEERADVAGPGGVVDSATSVEPMANYFAGRLRRDFRNGQTVVGGMMTLNNREQSPLFTNLMSTSSGFGGLDFEHRWSSGKYIVSGFSVLSRVNASATVINSLQRSAARYFHRPDATSLDYDPARTNLTGRYDEVAFSRTGSWFGSVAVKQVTPGFEINDVGFQSRVDYRAVSPFWGYQSNSLDRWSRNKFAGVWTNNAWNFDGTPIFRNVGGSSNATLKNFWGVGLNGNYNPRYYDDRLLRGGPLAYRPAQFYVGGFLNSDTRRKVWFNPYVNLTQVLGNDAWSANGGVYMESRPLSNLHITFGPDYSRNVSVSQWVRNVSDAGATATFGTRHVFANLEQTTLSLVTRLNWTMTPRLSLQTYLQPFVATGSYSEFKEFAAPRGFDFNVYGTDAGTITPNTDPASGAVTSYTVDPDAAGASPAFTIGNPNFNSHSLRGNAVLRWEYRPGSVLFFVWQQQRSGAESSSDFDAGRDVGAIFRERPTNIFLIKAAYWMSR